MTHSAPKEPEIHPGEADYDSATPQQRTFADLRAEGLGVGTSHRRAGYKGKSSGAASQLNARMAHAIDYARDLISERRRERMARLSDDVTAELRRIALSDITDVAEWKDKLVKLKDSEELPLDVSRAVLAVEEGAHGGLKVKMHPKVQALSELAKILKLSGSTMEVPAGARVSIEIPDNGRVDG